MMDTENLPTSLRSRRQRSGAIYFYFAPGRGIKEAPLGNDPVHALAQYHALQRKLLFDVRPDGLSALDLLTQFQNCTPRPATRHARARRMGELSLLHTFFTERGNPAAHSLPDLRTYQEWLERRSDARNFDSVRLLRHVWEFMRQHEYLTGTCPWPSISSHHERVTLELADILYPFATSELKDVLTQVLDRKAIDGTPLRHSIYRESAQDGSPPRLQEQLEWTKRSAGLGLVNSHRDDLLPSLSKLTVHDLMSVLRSPTRIRHLPPGKIDLTIERKLVISRLQQVRVEDVSKTGRKPDDSD